MTTAGRELWAKLPRPAGVSSNIPVGFERHLQDIPYLISRHTPRSLNPAFDLRREDLSHLAEEVNCLKTTTGTIEHAGLCLLNCFQTSVRIIRPVT